MFANDENYLMKKFEFLFRPETSYFFEKYLKKFSPLLIPSKAVALEIDYEEVPRGTLWAN